MQRLIAFCRHYEFALAALILLGSIGALVLLPPSAAVTCVVGDMQARYDAHIPADLSQTYFDAEQMAAGFGVAALGGWDGLGDALAAGGRVFVRHTNRASPRYYELAMNRYFQSNAFVYIPRGRVASGDFRIDETTRMDQLLELLARRFPQGVIAVGLVRFSSLRTIAIAAAAVADKPVTQHAVRYYTRPMETVSDSWAYVVLIAAREEERLAALLPPASMRTIPAGHALALRLREAPLTGHVLPTPESAVAVGQLLKDATAVEGQLALFPISHTFVCRDARATSAPAR